MTQGDTRAHNDTAVRGAETNRSARHYSTWLCHRCAPGRISAYAPGYCTQLPPRRRNRRSPWRRCSTGCCGTDVPGIRTPTPVSGGSWEQFCQPCPYFRVCPSVAITQVFRFSVIHQKKGFILSPCVPLDPLDFHRSRESVEMRHFIRLMWACIVFLSGKMKALYLYFRNRFAVLLRVYFPCFFPRLAVLPRHRSQLLSNPTKMELLCYSASPAHKYDDVPCRPIKSLGSSLRNLKQETTSQSYAGLIFTGYQDLNLTSTRCVLLNI